MKLISFAALSFLAITVSALPGPGTPHQSTTTQSALQHQSTTTQSALQHQSTGTPSAQRHQLARSRSAQDRYKQSLQAESEILREQYRENRALACKMKALINAIEKNYWNLEGRLKNLKRVASNKRKWLQGFFLELQI
ncbi:hypothetical protein BASA60_009615 [Batrachochytrium salamandrivorans]|nr:hypothetical protein BASA60_009615 [Batrachochytrium salamandrivorans]